MSGLASRPVPLVKKKLDSTEKGNKMNRFKESAGKAIWVLCLGAFVYAKAVSSLPPEKQPNLTGILCNVPKAIVDGATKFMESVRGTSKPEPKFPKLLGSNARLNEFINEVWKPKATYWGSPGLSPKLRAAGLVRRSAPSGFLQDASTDRADSTNLIPFGLQQVE
jgi:hypothetical protein